MQRRGTEGAVSRVRYCSAYSRLMQQTRAAAAKGKPVDQQGIAAAVRNRMDLTQEQKRMFFAQTNTRWKKLFEN